MQDSEANIAPFEELGLVRSGTSGDQIVADCPFCGGKKKFYLSPETQKWDCKAGKCGLRGNLITFLETWHSQQEGGDWEALSKDRGISVEGLKAADIVWDGNRWAIPVRNPNGRIQSFLWYRIGSKLRSMRGSRYLYNAASLKGSTRLPVILCEGEWDAIALLALMKRAKRAGEYHVVAVPGAATFKAEWAELLGGRDVLFAYDNDTDGVKGTLRAWKALKDLRGSFKRVVWADNLPDGFDVRDYCAAGGSFRGFLKRAEEYNGPSEDETENEYGERDVVRDFPALADGGRPTLEDTLAVYREHLLFTADMADTLRVIFAVVISIQMGGDPLWLHVVAPPGGTKTELLNSAGGVGNTIYRSRITDKTLVSGWKTGGGDPSLIPKLIGKVFILKDFTEILDMAVASRNAIYATLRGAYDGRVEADYGNGIFRDYTGFFAMVSGVTPAIFRDSSTVLGERFLYIRMKQEEEDINAIIEAAANSVGAEVGMRESLRDAAKAFLEWRYEPSEIPPVTGEQTKRLVALARLVASLRANVEKDFKGEKVLYRPQAEVATRLVKQLKKLLLCLGMQNTPPRVGEEEMKIVSRVALDSCAGWNLDAVRALMQVDGLTCEQIAERADIPYHTAYDRLKDLVTLGVMEARRGRSSGMGTPPVFYHISESIKGFWENSGLESLPGGNVSLGNVLREAGPKPFRDKRHRYLPMENNAAAKYAEASGTLKKGQRRKFKSASTE